MTTALLPLAIALALGTSPTLPDNPATPADQAQARQTGALDAVAVAATPEADTAESLAAPGEVLTGQRLDEAKASSLGETVNKLPGVQASCCGPGVGRPIVRGFDVARVQ